MSKSVKIIPDEIIERRICVIRGQKIMLDFDLAELYGVPTKVLNQAVTRNKDRFPDDFMFRLSADETVELNQSRIVTGTQKHRDPRYPPRAFTQEGVAMLSSVLRSKQAVQVNIAIMRTFVRMRQAMASHEQLSRRIDEVEDKYDARFKAIFDALRELMRPPDPPKRPIGYIHNE